jgi:alpha-glucosidase
MTRTFFFIAAAIFFMNIAASGQKARTLEVNSPDGSITLRIETGKKITWEVGHKGQTIIAPSSVSMETGNGEVLGADPVIKKVSREAVNIRIEPLNYHKSEIEDRCNQLTIHFRNHFGLIFRVYDNAVAYRFFTDMKGDLIIKNEEACFNFTEDYRAFIPYMWDYRDGRIFNCSFESLYTVQKISQFRKDSLAFLPLMVDIGSGKKVAILEADLEDYPGMFLDVNRTHDGFRGVYAPYPLEYKQVGINLVPVKRAEYTASVKGTRNFPWRIVVLSEQDKDLLNVDIVQELASPPRLTDLSWIVPGQVAWDWWNRQNISHVDFRAGMNTATYKYFIDFAKANNAKYIILDGGWSVRGDLTKAIPAIDLKELVDYGRQKNIGLILWASWVEILKQMDTVFPFYSNLGIKGLKIDFIDRDDQVAVTSLYEIARKAADNHLIIDFHGVFKPAGLQRTYPKVVGFEGVKGMENVKWANEDVPTYDVTIPFIRNMAGPMDYTPGAMRNATREDFRPVNANPMSQGTRCHQFAMYVVFEVPLQMLSDNPTIYMKEQESTDFITSVPTVFDETVPLSGEVGEYVAIARRKGETWFVSAMTNWTPRELILDFSFLGKGSYRAVIFSDGINADRDATDYRKTSEVITSGEKLSIHLAPGGGWAARIEKVSD